MVRSFARGLPVLAGGVAFGAFLWLVGPHALVDAHAQTIVPTMTTSSPTPLLVVVSDENDSDNSLGTDLATGIGALAGLGGGLGGAWIAYSGSAKREKTARRHEREVAEATRRLEAVTQTESAINATYGVVAAFNAAWQAAAALADLNRESAAAQSTYAIELIPKLLQAAGDFQTAALHVGEESLEANANDYYAAVLNCVGKASAADVTAAFDVVDGQTQDLRRRLSELTRKRAEAIDSLGTRPPRH